MMASATHDSASLILQCSGDIGLGGLKSRHEAEDDSGEDGDSEVEKKKAEIGRAGDIHASGIGRQIDLHERAIGPKRHGKPGEASKCGEGQTLNQKHRADARTRIAQCQAQTDLLYAPGTTPKRTFGDL